MPRHVDRERLRMHVARIAAEPRPTGSNALDDARRYVAQCLAESGWVVREHPFESPDSAGGSFRGINLVAANSRHPVAAGPRLCVGAHLDSVPDSPGADDNATAVAGLLEIPRLLPADWPVPAALELELVVFDLEEYGILGGAHRAAECRRDNVDLRGMVALEMLGYCSHTPNSQLLPKTLKGKYPDVGNWIAVIGNQNSESLISGFVSGMKSVAGLNVESLQVPSNGELLQATRLSDHSPFWDAGYPALMITDTAFLRNPHYHLPTDTVETLDFDFYEKVVAGCLAAVTRLVRDSLSSQKAAR
jgi:aminopeptidase YwaD